MRFLLEFEGYAETNIIISVLLVVGTYSVSIYKVNPYPLLFFKGKSHTPVMIR